MSAGRLCLAVFVVLQIADGMITYEAVRLFGHVAEGNPLLATWMAMAGAGPALFGAKAMACGCAVFLYACGAHRTLAGLTTLYGLGAVAPWLHVISVVAHA
jgi:hypothetical protein